MEENNKNQEINNDNVIETQITSENSGKEGKKKGKSVQREILEWVQAIAIAVVLALLVRTFVFTVVKVDGQSMEPTLQNSDRMIVWRLGYKPKAGDVVVFNPPGYAKNVYWIKRVIATEGQTVKIDYKTNSVYVDGKKIDEPYLGEEMLDPSGDYDITEITVPKDCVFAMGDNRNHSTDSRFVGCISEDSIVGEANLRFWPLNKIKTY